MTFRKQLQAERDRLDITQAQCAQILSVSLRTITDWEARHNPTIPFEVTQEGALARLKAIPSPDPVPTPAPTAENPPQPAQTPAEAPAVREW